MAKVFVSYSRKDIDFAKRLTAELQKSDLDFWIDWEGIPPTVDWWREIEKGIEEADAFLFLISPDSSSSKVCGMEIDDAVKNGKRIIPLMVRDIKGEETPKQLNHLNWIFFREQDDFDASIQKLLNGIHTDYDWVATHRRLQVRALEWQRAYKEKSLLLRGKDLRTADVQLKTNSTKEPHSTELQQEYLKKSHRARTTQRITISLITIATLYLTFYLYTIAMGSSARSADTDDANYLLEEKSAQHLAVIANYLMEKDPSNPTVPVLLAVHALTREGQTFTEIKNQEARDIIINYLKPYEESYQGSLEDDGNDFLIGIDGACFFLPRNLTQDEWKKYFGEIAPYEKACPYIPDEIPSSVMSTIDISGHYRLEGIEMQNKNYTGKVTITKTINGYDIAWNIGNETYTGQGIFQEGTLVVKFARNNSIGRARYRINEGNIFFGDWTIGTIGGNETLTPSD